MISPIILLESLQSNQGPSQREEVNQSTWARSSRCSYLTYAGDPSTPPLIAKTVSTSSSTSVVPLFIQIVILSQSLKLIETTITTFPLVGQAMVKSSEMGREG